MGLLALATLAYLPLLGLVWCSVIHPARTTTHDSGAAPAGDGQACAPPSARRMLWLGAAEVALLTFAHGLAVAYALGVD